MKKFSIITVLLVFSLHFGVVQAQSTFKKLVWSDEFNYSGVPDSSKWSYDLGHGCPENCGWGNNELQYYAKARLQNSEVKNGHLYIRAIKENYEGAKYSSARLVSKNKGDWKYGKIEVRAKLPAGRGLWPAIWMLPTDWKYGGWPNSGEIDIMENVGYWPDTVFGTIHTASYNGMLGTQKVKGLPGTDYASAFHIYSIEWNEKAISFYIDNKLYNYFQNENQGFQKWPFDQRFHILLNIAVGGNWGGKYGVDESVFPQTMEVDYVRVYQ